MSEQELNTAFWVKANVMCKGDTGKVPKPGLQMKVLELGLANRSQLSKSRVCTLEPEAEPGKVSKGISSHREDPGKEMAPLPHFTFFFSPLQSLIFSRVHGTLSAWV